MLRIKKRNNVTIRILIGITIIIFLGCVLLSGVSSLVIYVAAICPNPPCVSEDEDEDGLNDREESYTYHTDPDNPDSDGDRLKDGAEVRSTRTDPLRPDTDADRLSDGKEVFGWVYAIEESVCPVPGQPSGIYGCVAKYTNPLTPDTDGDSYTDWQEWCETSLPTDPRSPGAGSPVPDGCRIDSGTVNVPPVVNSQIVPANKNTPIKITLTGADQNGDKLSFVIESKPSIGALTAPISSGPTSAQTTYTPKPGFAGSVTFAFRASDGKAYSNLGIVTINVAR